MRILLVGAGGVGAAFCAIAARRDFFETIVVTDYSLERAQRAAAQDARYVAGQVDASSAEAVTALCREHRITHVMNAVDPVFDMPVFEGAIAAGADYLDMAMSLSRPHPERPHEVPGVKLGDEQFARAAAWEEAGRLALVGMGVEPGLSDVFARYAADHLFSEIDELGTRDGANLVVRDEAGHEIFAPSFSMWTTIEECLNPPVVWEDGDWHTTAPFSEPEVFDFPEGIGPVECVNVEHEEVLLMPRWVDCRRATFKYGLGEEMITILKVLHQLGLDSTEEVRVKGVEVSPRDVVAAVLPDPATIGPRMTGKTCAGLWVTGTGKDGAPRSTYVIEPIQGEGGFVVPAEGFLPALADWCRANDVVFIADEIQSGFCRTGDWFASDHEGVVPDLVTTAKGIAGGLPLAAVTGRSELMDAVHVGGLGGTYGGNPLACAAALGAIEEMETHDLLGRARAVEALVRRRLDAIAAEHPVVAEVRGRGAMLAIELCRPGTLEPDAARAAAVSAYCQRQGVVTLTCGTWGNVFRFLPPLSISDALLEEAFDVVAEAFAATA